MNKAIIIGNLTKDPELTQTTSGISVCRFTLAVSRKFTNAEGERETDFLNIVVWRNLADNCHKYLKKGSCVAVKGYIKTKNYEDSNGIKKFTFYIKAEEVKFLSSRNFSANENQTDYEPIDESKLPF